MPEPAKLVLIDGHALVYRAYFALPSTMATREPTVSRPWKLEMSIPSMRRGRCARPRSRCSKGICQPPISGLRISPQIYL